MARLLFDLHFSHMNNFLAPRQSPVKADLFTFGLCLSLLTSLVFSARASAQDHPLNPTPTMVICTNSSNPIHRLAADFIVKAYKRIGFGVEFVNLPNRRSLIQANEGACDAETTRIGGMDQTFNNLIPIPVIVDHMQGVAFLKHGRDVHPRAINSWEDLRGLQIYVVRGEVYAERGTADMGAGGSYKQLFTMLEQGRIDIGIGIHHVGLVELAHNFPDSSIHTHGAPLLNARMHHYIHHKNQHLLKDLTMVLEQMVESGELETIHAKALVRLMSQP